MNIIFKISKFSQSKALEKHFKSQLISIPKFNFSYNDKNNTINGDFVNKNTKIMKIIKYKYTILYGFSSFGFFSLGK